MVSGSNSYNIVLIVSSYYGNCMYNMYPFAPLVGVFHDNIIFQENFAHVLYVGSTTNLFVNKGWLLFAAIF